MVQPECLSSSMMAVPEFMMQRKLLGFGILLAWAVLFHVLVNVWLLCVFTSFVVVLGGWLGSQALLESESVIHLERFIKLDEIRSPPDSEMRLDQEIQNTVCKIIRDFVSSWYKTVSTERQFENEIHDSMISMAMELKVRAKKVDRKALTLRMLDLCGCHLQCYIKAKEIMAGKDRSVSAAESLWQAYSMSCVPHPALQSSAVEVNYARAIVDLLLHVLVPAPHLETRTGRFVVCELITCNVFLPLISKLSDPDWLNMLVVDVLTRAKNPEAKPAETEPMTSPTAVVLGEENLPDVEVPSSLILKAKSDTPSMTDAPAPDLAHLDALDSADLYCPQNKEDEGPMHLFSSEHPGFISKDFMPLEKSNPFYQETDSDLESPLNDIRRSSLESLVLIGTEEETSEPVTEFSKLGDNILDPKDEFHVCSNAPKVVVSEIQEQPSEIIDGTDELSSSFCTFQELEKVTTKAELSGMETSGLVNTNGLTLCEPLQASSPSTGSIPLSSFTFEPLSSPEGPVIIQNLRITGTITAKEHRGTGSHPYTLYTVKYETAVDSENPGSSQPMAYHMVNRRYSEFLNLQTRLEEKPELRKMIKHVKGPKKIFPELPFGNMDSDRVEARKGLLETFLKQLCAIPEAANSEEMQEFLALNTDARIAFVKKPFIVSRIDKIVVNAIVDTLKTAFPRSEPQSPTDEVDAEPDGKLSSDRKSKSRMRFSSKIAPALNVSDMKPKVLYCFDERSTVFNGLTLDSLENFILEREQLVSKAPLRDEDGERGVQFGAMWDTESCACSKQTQGETELADTVLNILCLLMKDQWSWLCTENIQRSIRLLFGTLIERYARTHNMAAGEERSQDDIMFYYRVELKSWKPAGMAMWLEVGVTNLTRMQYWVTYLRVLQQAVWPGGNLPAYPRPQRTQQQKDDTRQKSLQCLMNLLPEGVGEKGYPVCLDLVSDILGPEKYNHTWQVVLDSLQDSTINRHLVYGLWDVLIEFLIPELSDDNFQKMLLQSLSKNAEKLPP
ncbi:Sorting nexin-19 [Bagarius yarrelli]|uniref:Sorting nexin-19 n=1 Tax=Bagarius yarrelli TaxID=175774 RepID=A0A556UZX9_BAGYA|nr:Sorting nexin-19 [Bagarius yarrelli]